MLTTKQYDLLNRLTNISSSSSSSFSSSGRYAYNSANQRTKRTDADASYWNYTYDSLGQVISGKRHWSDNTPVAGEQYEYAFDDIGNRTSTAFGGDQFTGSYLRSASYVNNSLNQMTTRDVPGYLNIVGTANSNATVTLWTTNGLWAQASRHAEYYRGELAVNNSTGALYLTITNLAVLPNGTNSDIITNSIGNAFVPLTPESFTYDADGNLTSDGGFTNLWDAENRVRGFGIRTNKPGPAPGIVSGYDYLGRRISKIVLNLRTGIGPITTKYVYDGWNLVAVLDNTSSLLYSFAWGTDVSGTAQGAGGVGGLLSMTVHSGANAGTYFYVYDGNGNVTALVNATNGVVAAQYEYGPFGELIRATGPMAFTNPFRFSTKFQDDETGLLYYGYRYYNPSTGRWLSREPIGESAGPLYAFVLNQPLSGFDVLGNQGLFIPANSGQIAGYNPYPAVPTSPLNPVDKSPAIGAWELGFNYLLGVGETDRKFTSGDYMTESLKKSELFGARREQMRILLRDYCNAGVKGEAPVLNLGNELGAIPWYKFAFWTFPKTFLLNPPEAFTGSFSAGTVTATKIDCAKCQATIHVHAYNASGAASNTRFPPFLGGYNGDPSIQFYAEGVLHSHNPTYIFNFLGNVRYSSSLLSDNPFGGNGPLRTISQTYDWDEDLDLTK